jgi:hypothetical protein
MLVLCFGRSHKLHAAIPFAVLAAVEVQPGLVEPHRTPPSLAATFPGKAHTAAKACTHKSRLFGNRWPRKRRVRVARLLPPSPPFSHLGLRLWLLLQRRNAPAQFVYDIVKMTDCILELINSAMQANISALTGRQCPSISHG